MVPKSPRISVIIPVKNMAGKIEQCLKAVFAQSLLPYEVIVVDGRSTDGTAERAQKFPVKVVYQDYGAAGAARQIGLESASSEYVAFTDADCIPDKNWLRNLVSEFKDDIVGIGGATKNVGKGLWTKSINLAQSTFIGGGSSVQTRLFGHKKYVKSISACNSMYRKRDVVDVGGFNIHLSGADETELNRRLVKTFKGRLLYVPEAVVLHDHRRNLKDFAVNMYRYGGWRRECRVWDLPAIPPLIAPSLLLTLLINLWILPALFSLYLAVIVIAGLLFTLREKDARYLFSIPIVYLVEHICYALGFWKEILHPTKHVREGINNRDERTAA